MSGEKKRRRPRGNGALYRRGRNWFIAYTRRDGKRKAESARTDRKSVAEQLLRDRVAAITHNLPVIARVEQVLFDKAADAVIDDFVANGKKSIKVVRRRIAKNLKPFFGGRRLVSISTPDVLAYIQQRKSKQIVVRKERRHETTGQLLQALELAEVSNAEINRDLQLLKRVFSLAMQHGRIADKPVIKMLKEKPARSTFFEPDQYEAILSKIRPEVRPVITFAYITGWRVASEILPLQWRQVDFAGGEIRLAPGTTKNGSGRVLPFRKSRELTALLTELWEQNQKFKRRGMVPPPWVFYRMVEEHEGGPEKPRPFRNITKAWNIARKQCGLPGVIPHDLRRTAIRNLVRNGISENIAMRLTGHKTRSVFDRYDIVSGSDLEDAVAKLDAAFGFEPRRFAIGASPRA